jgi:hypothetical protein
VFACVCVCVYPYLPEVGLHLADRARWQDIIKLPGFINFTHNLANCIAAGGQTERAKIEMLASVVRVA